MSENIESLENEIALAQTRLDELQEIYKQTTGNQYISPASKHQHNWTRLMMVGFAFISCFIYMFGVRGTGKGELPIPDFVFSIDVQYYLVLTFYVLIAILIPQSKSFKGYQLMQLFLGFWCMHWLVYDWWWWAYEMGLGHLDLPAWWNDAFYSPLLMKDPPMWLFLIEALLGSGIGLYTLFVPKCNKHLAPAWIYLYTVYMNASVFLLFGVDNTIILAIGICLLLVAYGLAIYFMIEEKSFQKLAKIIKKHLPIKKAKVSDEQEQKQDREEEPERKEKVHWSDKLLSFDPFKKPWSYVMFVCLVTQHILTATVVGVGLIVSIIPWFVIPILYFFKEAIDHNDWNPVVKKVLKALLIALLIFVCVFMNLITTADIV